LCKNKAVKSELAAPEPMEASLTVLKFSVVGIEQNPLP
jgi:hypothetical protein